MTDRALAYLTAARLVTGINRDEEAHLRAWVRLNRERLYWEQQLGWGPEPSGHPHWIGGSWTNLQLIVEALLLELAE